MPWDDAPEEFPAKRLYPVVGKQIDIGHVRPAGEFPTKRLYPVVGQT